MGSISTTTKRDDPKNAGNQNQQPNSPFDRLPDDVVHIILNKVQDAKTLLRCLTLNKRFASIVPQIDVVSLPLYVSHRPRHSNNNGNANNNLARGNPVNILKSVVNCIITRLLLRRENQLRRRGRRGDNVFSMTDSLCQCPPQLLQPFRHITHLNFELHTYGGALDNVFLKWKASYGGELKTCVVLCATSFRRFAVDESPREEPAEEDETTPTPASMPNDEFKSRIMWTISCLIAASARHLLLKQMLAKFPTVKTLRITDARRQGRFSMAEDEIRDLRESLKEEGSTEISAERVVPDLRMRMWYVPELDLPAARCEMKGATLLVIGPADSKGELVPPPEMYGVDGGYDGDAAEKALFAEAEIEIVKMKKRSSYVMEMTSF